MKYFYIITASIMMGLFLLNCDLINKQKNIPKNTIFLFDDNEETNIYVVDIQEYKGFNYIGNGDYYLFYRSISGNYPKSYSTKTIYIHVIPENNIFKHETMLGELTFYENNKSIGHAEPNGEWVFSGYSTDENNNLNKIVDYLKQK